MSIKKNTDIGDFAVTKVPTVNENISLNQMRTIRSYHIEKYKKKKAKRLRHSQVRVSRLLKDLEKD